MRRRSLIQAAAAAALAGRLAPAEAQHVHQHHTQAAAQAGADLPRDGLALVGGRRPGDLDVQVDVDVIGRAAAAYPHHLLDARHARHHVADGVRLQRRAIDEHVDGPGEPPPGGDGDQHHDDQRGGLREAHDLHRPDRRLGGRGAHDHAGVAGEVPQEPRRVLQHPLELAVRLLEEGSHLDGVGPAQGRRLAEVVDEEPVALLGRDAPRARVGLAEVAVVLEGGHVVADRGRRDLHAGRLHDVRGPHRLGGVDVLLHDGPEDGGLAFVEHGLSRSSQVGPDGVRPGTRSYRVLTGEHSLGPSGQARPRTTSWRRRPSCRSSAWSTMGSG